MIIELQHAIDLCIDALNNKKEDSQEVVGNDKYILKIVKSIAKFPYKGRNLGIGLFNYNHRDTFQDVLERCTNNENDSHSFKWLDVILLLYDFANYDDNQILESAQKINDNATFNHILQHIISNCVVIENIYVAESFIFKFRKEKAFSGKGYYGKGYLIILQYFALKGDKKNFFRHYKLFNPVVNREEAHRCKEVLITAFTIREGLEKSIELCNHKYISYKYLVNTLTPFVEQGKYNELKNIINKYVEFEQIGPKSKLTILTQAYLQAKKLKLEVDDDFDELFSAAEKISRKVRFGEKKLRDAILLDLGFANAENKERVFLCRKAIGAYRTKWELAID
jgi:hypothetical protein